jgi:hypothetical protein
MPTTKLPLIPLALWLLAWTAGAAAALESQAIFERSEAGVYQIRVINRETGKKSSIGSGFIFGRRDQLATNYHVVSAYIEKPEIYRLQYLAANGDEGDLALVNVDVVHDLALVRAPHDLGPPFELAEPPPKGANLYAMGNPLDLGLTLAAGTNGGVLSQTDASRILFSGSLNPGMSGGPTFDDAGRVVGINVSTARNDISFIVPGRFLRALPAQPVAIERMTDDIGRQIHTHQTRYLDRIIDNQWNLTTVRQMEVPGVISPTIRCWDASPKQREEHRYSRLSISCENENDIYLSDRLEVGKVLYEYHWVESDTLGALRFYRLYESLNASQFGGRADEEDVERFACDTEFVDINGQAFKATLCARQYKRYPQLHDVLFTAAMVGENDKGFIFNMDLAGSDVTSAIRLITRMLGAIRWQP